MTQLQMLTRANAEHQSRTPCVCYGLRLVDADLNIHVSQVDTDIVGVRDILDMQTRNPELRLDPRVLVYGEPRRPEILSARQRLAVMCGMKPTDVPIRYVTRELLANYAT